MAVQFGPYFINAETFSGASGVWTNSALTTCAPDGYYSNGVIQRYLSSGTGICTLGPVLDCPSCAPPSVACGGSYNQDGSASDMFRLTVGLGSGMGVALIGIDPLGVPDGIAARFPSGSGEIIAEGSSQVYGYASNNNPSIAIVLENHIVFVGDGSYGAGYPGLTGGSSSCSSATWDCATYPAGTPASSGTYDYYDWDDVAGAFPPLGSPTGTLSFEITNYNGASGVQLSTVTQMGIKGLDKYGACQANTVVSNCSTNVGVFYIPIPKPTAYAQSADVVFCGSPTGSTVFDFVLLCPQVPTPFEMSDLITETNDPAIVPACTDGTPGVYPNTLYQVSLYNQAEGITGNSPGIPNATGNALYNNGVLAINSFAYQQQYPSLADTRWNEGGTFKYQWYKVNLVTGGPNANKTLKLNSGALNWGESFSDTSALIQIDDNGVITNIIPCNN